MTIEDNAGMFEMGKGVVDQGVTLDDASALGNMLPSQDAEAVRYA